MKSFLRAQSLRDSRVSSMSDGTFHRDHPALSGICLRICSRADSTSAHQSQVAWERLARLSCGKPDKYQSWRDFRTQDVRRGRVGRSFSGNSATAGGDWNRKQSLRCENRLDHDLGVRTTKINAFLDNVIHKTEHMRIVDFPWTQRLKMAVAWGFPVSTQVVLNRSTPSARIVASCVEC